MSEDIGFSQNPGKLYKLQGWFSGNRLWCAWELVKQAKLREGSQYTADDLCRELKCAKRSLYRWINGEGFPLNIYLERIDQIFTRLIGEDWMEKVEKLERNIRGGDEGDI